MLYPARVFSEPIRDIVALPTITIYANPPKGDPYWGLGGNSNGPVMPPPGAPPGNIGTIGMETVANGEKFFAAANEKDPISVVDAFFQGLSGRSAAYVYTQLRYVGLFTQWMAAGGYQQVVGANQFGLTPAQAANTSTIFGLYATQQKQLLPIEDFRFYGGPLMPFAGIYYWIEGRGAPRSMDVRSMNLDMEITDFKPITDIISNREMGPGTYQISAHFSTNLFNHMPFDFWAAGLLGRVGGTINGTLVMHGSEALTPYSFNGEFTLDPDIYDADPSNRPFYQEALTDFLRAIGNLFGHTDYQIKFPGSQPVSFNGVRPPPRI